MAEHGFFHPICGYWQTNDDVTEEILAGYPGETIEVPLKPGAGYDFNGTDWVAQQSTLEEFRVAKIAAIDTMANALLAAGAPVDFGLHIALDDKSLSDIAIMSGIATAALSGAVSWPESYARGWIAIENIRIPLATPAAGLALATATGSYCSAIVQRRRDLKDAVLAAEGTAPLEAIGIATGWPT